MTGPRPRFPDWPQLVRDDPLAPENDSALAAPDTFTLLTDAELDALPDSVFDIDGILPTGALVSVIGPRGVFKSFLMLAWAASIALGLPWHGRAVRRGAVLYAFGEGGNGMRKRLRALRRLLGIDGPIVGLRFLPMGIALTDDAVLAKLVRTIEHMPEPPRVVTIDTLTRFFGRGDQNDAADMTAFVSAADTLRQRFGCTVVVVHHTPWSELRSRGSTVLPDAADAEITVERRGESDVITVRNSKQKDAEPFAPIMLQFLPVAGTGSGVLMAVPEDDAAEQSLDLQAFDAIRRSPEPLAKRAIRDAIRGGGARVSNKAIDDAVDALRARGWIEYATAAGRRGWRARVDPLRHGAGTSEENSAPEPGTPGHAPGTGPARPGTASGTTGPETCAGVPGPLGPARGTFDPITNQQAEIFTLRRAGDPGEPQAQMLAPETQEEIG